MSGPSIFSCPSCAAQLRVDGTAYQVKCPYCGSLVTVPPELRRPDPVAPPPPPPVVQAPPVVTYRPTPVARRRSAGSSCAGFLITLLLLVVAGVTAFAWYRYNNGVIVVPNLVSTGDGQLQQTFGGAGTGPGLFQDASRIAVDGAGFIYVADSKAPRIQRFDANGTFVNLWDYERQSNNAPVALAADRAGNLYISGSALSTSPILKYEGATGKKLAEISSPDDKTAFIHWGFQDVAVLADGGLLAFSSDLTSDDLVHFDAQGQQVARLPKLISSVTGSTTITPRIAADGLGNIFALEGTGVDSGENAVFYFTADGKFVNRFGSVGDAEDQLDQPAAIAVDNQSRVYVSDFRGVHIFDRTGRRLGHVGIPGDWGYVPALAFTPQNDLLVLLNNQILRYRITLPVTP
jgi:sugar lactone lactonase YvrE